MKINIIKDNEEIRNALIYRRKQLELTLAEMVTDSKIRGMKNINISTLSLYLNNHKTHNLSSDAIAWLACRYGINIDVIVEVDDPFDDKKALEKLKIKFQQ